MNNQTQKLRDPQTNAEVDLIQLDALELKMKLLNIPDDLRLSMLFYVHQYLGLTESMNVMQNLLVENMLKTKTKSVILTPEIVKTNFNQKAELVNGEGTITFSVLSELSDLEL